MNAQSETDKISIKEDQFNIIDPHQHSKTIAKIVSRTEISLLYLILGCYGFYIGFTFVKYWRIALDNSLNSTIYNFMKYIISDEALWSILVLTIFETIVYSLTGTTILAKGTIRGSEGRVEHNTVWKGGDPRSTGVRKDDKINHNSTSLEPSFFNDRIEYFLHKLIDRSLLSLGEVQNQPKVLLIVGTFIALAGFLFFYFTLPQLIISPADMNASYIFRVIIEVLPRLLMLLFLQLLAGFFLRQYRNAMEDYRYFEALHRFREELLICYLIKKEFGTRKEVSEFTSIIVQEKNFHILKSGDKLVQAEVSNSDPRELSAFVKQIMEAAKSIEGRIVRNRDNAKADD